ncbi:hypothetical protein QBC46DRAFT_361449 [Diplogelasinospora grovesii]|uniref:Zn(2)-C6 fungal-type domain-containing protein n=1 Tax=Diplogelasinospora grovesii TaxID=303347 RepID=A0AAN6NFM9_9PEZI|nr:hypothetical protein QBC46DRAFT_361449 [Diplogelasinospora grovesii]
MAGMSGFTVFQPTLGAALQWLPALGTRELDNMINAFLPGPASIQDKRAHISMDFFEYARQTGETFRFYPISAAPFTSITVESSASSAALHDSGYGSSFNVSPVVPDLTSWTQSPAALAPSASFDENKAKTRSASSPSSSKKANASSSRQQTTDFANHPGMRIMTKDGRDITNSASRGCKTREQRDHAHLMRIIKACDSCRRKKIRCDPSHKKRSASQASSTASQLESRPAKKAKKAADPPPLALPAVAPDFTVAGILEGTEAAPSLPAFDVSLENFDELWSQFVQFEPEAPVLATNYNIPEDYDFFFDAQGRFTPSSGWSSASPSQLRPEISPSAPTLPYLNPGGTHGTNYLDFNLYSPASDFMDEEPLLAKQDLPSAKASCRTDHVS